MQVDGARRCPRIVFAAALLGCGSDPAASVSASDSGASITSTSTGSATESSSLGSSSPTSGDAGGSSDSASAGTTTSEMSTAVDSTAATSTVTTTTSDATSDTSTSSTSDTGIDRRCGDGEVDVGEVCDDGNVVALDGCEADCSSSVVQIDSGQWSACVLLVDGILRCWGSNSYGQLALGHLKPIGLSPRELPLPAAQLGGKVLQFELGVDFGCAVMEGGAVRCWGANWGGQLGIGHTESIGDDPGELPPKDTPIGGKAVEVAVGPLHACARLDTGDVRCWGENEYGQLGLGDTATRGSLANQLPTMPVPLGGKAVRVRVGYSHSCALLEDGTVRCWGRNEWGALGYGHVNHLGDQPNELPPPAVDLGGAVLDVRPGIGNTCALRADGEVRCWGWNYNGILGLGNDVTIGDGPGEMPPAPVPLGGPVAHLGGNYGRGCALMMSGAVRCWGDNSGGELGYGNFEYLGDEPDELPPPDVQLGGVAISLESQGLWSCAQLNTGEVRCWGGGLIHSGGNEGIGDDELPDSIPPMPLF